MASADTSENDDAPVPPIDDARAELQAAVPEAAETFASCWMQRTNGFNYEPPK